MSDDRTRTTRAYQVPGQCSASVVDPAHRVAWRCVLDTGHEPATHQIHTGEPFETPDAP